MSLYQPGCSYTTLTRSFGQDPSLPLGEIFTAKLLENTANRHHISFGEIWNGALTMWAWLMQILCSDRSCVYTLPRVVVLLLALGLPACSQNTGAYCKARCKLGESFLRDLALDVGRGLERLVPDRWRWRRRRVVLVDGTTLTAPDTPENQKEYPQMDSQQPGLGFPILRLVVLFGLATASLLGCNFGPYQGEDTGETALLRPLLDELEAGDVLVGDRYYCSYWLVVMAQERGILVCFRLHQSRKAEFRKGPGQNPEDFQMEWQKPAKPDWMDQDSYNALPATIKVRIIDYVVRTPGFRTWRVKVATTLLCGSEFAKEDIADLYHKRWHIEVDIRSIKHTLGMAPLTSRSPEMLRAEIWAHWLSYNLARLVEAQAALADGCEPREISFTALKANLGAFSEKLATAQDKQWHNLVREMWRGATTIKVGNRPDRCEPREKKERPPRKYPPLRRPRQQARAALLEEAKKAQAAAESASQPADKPTEPAKKAKRQSTKQKTQGS